MQKRLGVSLSFLFLCAMTFIGVSCSDSQWCDSAPCCEQPSPSVGIQGPVGPVNYDGQDGYADNQGPIGQSYDQGGYSAPADQGSCCAQPACAAPCAPACASPCAAPCAPVCAPACAPEPCCKPIVRCKHPSSNQLRCLDYITVTARNPRMCLLGDQYPLEFDVQACDDVCDVVVTTNLPEGVSLIKSEPEALVEGRKLTWNFGGMSKGECRPARVLLKCECEGELCACFCATATPVRFCALLCAKPILTCEKCGPCQVCPGDPVNYTITVSNQGSCTAEEVVVTDNIPPELEHCSGLKTLVYKLGCLAPCETKRVNIALTAVKRGRACNTAVVSACNADSSSCQWCTNICLCAVDLIKVGPKEVPIGKNADYQITATNVGDITLTDVVVTDTAPSSTSIVAANGACINGNQAVWNLREIKPGEKVVFGISLTTCTPGCFTNKVALTDCQNCNACSETTTRWKGRPALTVCITDSDDPICIGERTRYTVTLMNQGSEADSHVNVVLKFPNQLTPITATGDTCGTINGKTVTFAPYENLRQRQTLTYYVDAEAKSSGEGRVITEVSSDTIKTPIVQQESTTVN